jgi:hypothetical protein
VSKEKAREKQREACAADQLSCRPLEGEGPREAHVERELQLIKALADVILRELYCKNFFST